MSPFPDATGPHGARHGPRPGPPRRPAAPALRRARPLLLLLGSLVLLAQAPLPAVGVLTAQPREIAPAAEFVGRVEAVNAVDIRARIEGFIESRPFAEGGMVQEGQPLFRIEPGNYEAALAAARANLAGARAVLREAEARLQRSLQLRQSNTVSQAVLEENQAARASAEAAVLGAEAGLRQAEINLGYTIIGAPISGQIGVAGFAIGSLVGPSSGALARVVQLDPIRVVFSVSDRAILDLRAASGHDAAALAGAHVPRLRLSNGQDYPLQGEIEFAGNEVDPRTGTIAVRARFANPDALLIPGQFVTVVIRAAAPRRGIVVPVGAVQLDREGRFVLLVDAEDRVALRRIRTGAQIGQGWLVEEGLAGGERLVVQGLQNARPGQQVRVTQAAAP